MSKNNRVVTSYLSSLDEQKAEALIEKIAYQISEDAVRTTLTTVGFDLSQPIALQQDMAGLREIRQLFDSTEFQRDIESLRAWRKNLDSIKQKGFMFIMTSMGLGGAGLVALALVNSPF